MCSVCDPLNLALCYKCIPPFVLHEGICITGCPGGFDETSDNAGCYSTDVKDIGIFYFPFLIAALFGCLIALCGNCKKKTGRTKFFSSQNTLTSFIVIISFIQFLAIIAMLLWAFYFDKWLLFLAACILIGVLLLLNLVF